MTVSHESLVFLAKCFGLFWLMGLFMVICIWTCWPSRRHIYERAARAILQKPDQVSGS
jgi:cytochrome c oxidase cbb3-type subunit 4